MPKAPKALKLKPTTVSDENQRRTGAPKDGQRLLGVHVAEKTSHAPIKDGIQSPPLIADDALLDIDEVCVFFGGNRPLHPATIYRGIGVRYPHPVKVGPNSNRWLRSECQAALDAMAAERGRPRKHVSQEQNPAQPP
jgi:predicted DNA-binding transcriptional regulator AlpA